MNTNEIECLGLQALVRHLKQEFSERVTICDIRNAASHEKQLGCDLIIKLDDKDYFFELKASRDNGLPTNIRFKHQTIATMYNAGVLQSMIVAYVYNLAKGVENAKFKFFRFGDFRPDQIYIEPHFIVQPKQAMKSAEASGVECPIKDSLGAVFSAMGPSHDIGKLFDSRVSEHMKLRISK